MSKHMDHKKDQSDAQEATNQSNTKLNEENTLKEDQETQNQSGEHEELTVADQESEEKAEREVSEAAKESEEISEIDQMKKDLEESRDKYLRLYSEFENFRRRNARERLELIKTANEDLVESLLPVLDDFERARNAIENGGDLNALKEGVDLIYNKMRNVLEQKGLKPMDNTVGSEFNAEYHEAITQIPAPSKELQGKIVDVIEKGYYLNDKVVRFAKVVIGA